MTNLALYTFTYGWQTVKRPAQARRTVQAPTAKDLVAVRIYLLSAHETSGS